jgi:hypothetical protein
VPMAHPIYIAEIARMIVNGSPDQKQL